MITLLYCILAFILGLGLGWAIFKPSENDDDEDEDDEMMDWHPRYAPTMEEDLMKEADKSNDPERSDDFCNGCVHLFTASNQDSEDEYVWKCRRYNSYICSTEGLLDAIRRPSNCREKED